MFAIETENLTKYYKRSKGIENVTFKVREGDFFGFIGPNGAGKSTTIRTLLGLVKKTSGSARVLGKDIDGDIAALLRDVGYMPADAAFWSGMRVKDIIELSARLRGKDCKKTADELCERLQLDTSKKADALSFGNKKKVGIVCALQHDPRLYILDEPTSGLDPLMQREFFSILKERNERGATVFLSSHVLSEVSRYCKNAAIIRDGTILVEKSVAQLGHTGVKKVTLTGLRSPFDLAAAKDVKVEGDRVKFLFSSTSGELISALSRMDFDDFTVSDPELDEVFLHYYTKEEK